ncbi:MAG: AAA family ATPase [Betaproteobacteria bacterium]|nr:MAG: AAA family ATPase [Betaproteobacteria bacterium]TMG77763.1 MAG: AAA family ATPase [Betaproteobacteria bacterium]
MTTAAVSIPIGGFKDVYDVAEVDRALQELSASANDALKSTYEKMIKAGGTRLTVKPSGIPAMEGLYDELPNFAEVLDDVKKHIALCASSNDCLELPPMLLLGEPGIGKTYFGRRLSQILSTGFGLCSMSSMTAGWVISGASSQWKNAKPGKVFETLLNGTYANPVIMVDELDKAGGDNQYDPLGALYMLLERDTAAEFVDEFVEIPIDASGVVWIATANENSKIPDPILNRMNVYEIESPDRNGSARIAQAIYGEIRGSHDWGKDFPERLPQEVQNRLAELSPREMRRAVMNAFGNAKLAGRAEIESSDIGDSRSPKKQRIGF